MAFIGARMALEAEFSRTLRANTHFDRFRHRELATTAAAFSFMMDFEQGHRGDDFTGGELDWGVVEVPPEEGEGFGRRGIRRDTGFLGVDKLLAVENGPEEFKSIFVVGAGEQFYEVGGFLRGLADFEGEPDASPLAGHGEGCVMGLAFANQECFGINHEKKITHPGLSVNRLVKINRTQSRQGQAGRIDYF